MRDSYKNYLKTWEDFEVEWYETHLDDSECEPDLSDYNEIMVDEKKYWVHEDDWNKFYKMFDNRERQKKYRDAHPEKYRKYHQAYQKQYREIHKEKIAEKAKMQRAKKIIESYRKK